MKNSIMMVRILAIFMVIAILASCNKDNDQPVDEVTQMINEVRALTESYTVYNEGIAAGWDTDLSGCVAHPTEGGMGHHFGRMEYIDGRVNHLEPQVLLYAPDNSGNMEFLGVEYMVPFAVHSESEEPPTLFNQNFHQNHEIEMWTLHLWSEKENPSGIFYDWNPNVSCN